jgi:hypothetical protein
MSAPIKSNTFTSDDDIPQAASDINLAEIKPETIKELRETVDRFEQQVTPFEKKMREEKKQRQLQREKALREALDKESINEEFEIPLRSGKRYRFIGYDSDQYIEINKAGFEADQIPKNERGSEKYKRLEIEVYKKMIKFSFLNIPDDVIDRMPKNQLYWFYLLAKEKNDNPLPFPLKG